MYAYGRPAPNPAITLGTGLGLLGGLALTAAGAYGASRLIEGRIGKLEPHLPLGPGGIPPEWLQEVGAVREAGGTVGSASLEIALPTALNVLGIDAAEGPGREQFPFVTQPEAPLLIAAKRESLEEPAMQVPLLYLFATADGEVGFRVDTDELLAAGIAFDLTEDVTYADGTQQGAFAQVNALITNLTAEAAQMVWGRAIELVATEGHDFSEASGTRDRFNQEVLSALVPSFDWSNAPNNIGLDADFGSSIADLWRGVELVAQLAYQRHWLEQG